MCVVIYLCLTSDSFPPCGRNSHVTARNTAGDPRDLSCNIRTHHVSSEPENISILSTSFCFWSGYSYDSGCLALYGMVNQRIQTYVFTKTAEQFAPSVDNRSLIFFPFYMIETKDYENPRNANKFRPNETIPNECSEEEALMHTLDQVASSVSGILRLFYTVYRRFIRSEGR